MSTHQNERTRSFPRYLALGLLSLPLVSLGGCDSGSESLPGGDSTMVGGTTGTGATGVGGAGVGGATGTGATAATGGATGTGATAGTGAGTGVGGATTTGGATGAGGTTSNCTNVAPPYDPNWPDANCEKWANETTACGEDWFAEYCDEDCGRCTGGSTGGTSSGGGSSGGSSSGGSSGSGGSLGNDNPWGNVSGGQQGWASRYWDCCKQSCGWSANAGGNPVVSCNSSGANETNKDDQSACSNGSSTTCNSFAPWAYSNAVSFGFAATHAGSGVACGTCYQLQFTGSSHNGGNDPGSQALKDKVMIVMAANIGGDVSSGGQLDILIPGGGTGAFYGCGTAWGVQKGSSELGAEYGGLRAGCSGSLDGIKSCVANKCQTLFGSRGLTDMYDGCMWYVNWMQAADNPNFNYKQVTCPSELTSVAY